ncbi:MAG: nitrilase-related carbon-nitrogen hydrolase [Acidobacteriota bacterium]|nr:nitrilase-related carbon-nitrogen hydrolase [Acidobacteriota bacterium]
MKARAVQFSPRLGDLQGNLEEHRLRIQRARTDGCDLIVFPELSLTGYQLKDIVFDVALRPGDETISLLARESHDIDILVGAPLEEYPGIIYNCALYFSRGKLLHCHRKVQLPNFGMFEERMLYAAGGEFRTFRVNEFRVGILICREILFPANAWLYYLQYADLVIGISNSPFRGMGRSGFSSFSLWENMGYVHSVFYHQNYLFVNRSGFEDGIGFGGGSFFAPAGKGIQTRAPYFDAVEMDVEVDIRDVRRARLSGNYRRDERLDVIRSELERIDHE